MKLECNDKIGEKCYKYVQKCATKKVCYKNWWVFKCSEINVSYKVKVLDCNLQVTVFVCWELT